MKLSKSIDTKTVIPNNRKNRRTLQKQMSNKNISNSELIVSQCVNVDGILVHNRILETYLHLRKSDTRCGYCWFEPRDLNFDTVKTKNGQTDGKGIAGRLKDYETKEYPILWDILENPFFEKNTKKDQELNNSIDRKYKSIGIKVDVEKTTRCKEIISVPINLLNDFPFYKKNTLEETLNKNVNREFKSDYVHECSINRMLKSNHLYFLLDCVTRYGKSWDYLEYIIRGYHNSGVFKIHTVFCHDTKTWDGWKNKVNEYYPDKINLIELKNKKDFDFNQKIEKNTIVLISPQLVSANSEENECNIVTLSNLNIRCETIFVDEVHNYFTKKWKSYYESIISPSGKIILASGTAVSIILEYSDLFDETNTTIVKQDYLIKRLNELNIKFKTTVHLINTENLPDCAFNLQNLQSVTNGKIDNINEVVKFFNSLFNLNRKKRWSPFSAGNHYVILVDRVEIAKLMKEIILKNCSEELIPILVAGSNNDRDAITQTNVENIIDNAQNQGKGTITISCGSMIQGIGIRDWKNVVNMSSVSTYEIWYQLYGRLFEMDDIKDFGKNFSMNYYDFNPYRFVKVGAQYVEAIGRTSDTKIEDAKKMFFDIHDIVQYIPENNGFIRVDINKLSQEISEEIDPKSFNKGLKSRLITDIHSDVVLGMDEDLFEECLKHKDNGFKQRAKEIKLHQEESKKQKTNYTEKNKWSQNNKETEINIKDAVLDGLNIYTERIDIVTEVMYKIGIIKTKTIEEVMSFSKEDFFHQYFGFPNKNIGESFSKYILKNGDKIKINNRLSDSNRVPELKQLLKLDKKSAIAYFKKFEEIYNFEKEDNQVPFEYALEIIYQELDKKIIGKDDYFVDSCAKNGSLITAVAYYLSNERGFDFDSIINMIGQDSKNKFFVTMNEIMGIKKIDYSKKFSNIILNPPYGNSSVDFFNEGVELLKEGGRIISIQPSTPFLNTNTPKPLERDLKMRENVKKYKSHLKFVDGNEIFDAGFFVPLVIINLEKKLDEEQKINVEFKHLTTCVSGVHCYDNYSDIFVHGNDLVLGIRDKIFAKKEISLNDKSSKKIKNSPFWVKLGAISGHPPKDGKINPDFYCMIFKGDENNVEYLIAENYNDLPGRSNGKDKRGIAVENYESAINLIKTMMTKTFRFSLSLSKIGSNLWGGNMLDTVPYLDFSREWTDSMLYEYFEFSDEEITFINDYIGNWYERDFT